MSKEEYEYLANQIFVSSLEVHKAFGPGLLESAYEYALRSELFIRKINIERQVPAPLFYKGINTGKNFYIDLLVENEIIIELKAIEGILPIHEAQLISYLKLSSKKMGFLINFNVVLLKNGFKRFVNGY